MKNPASSARNGAGWGVSLALFFIPILAASQSQTPHKDRARLAFSTPIPPLDGQHLNAKLVEVLYGPGESSPVHSHPCAVVGYVVEGALRMRVEGSPEKTYSAGDSFYEAPNGIHAVSANASDSKPAKLIACFICDHETPLSVDVSATKGK